MNTTKLALPNGQDVVLLTVMGLVFISAHNEGATVRVGDLSRANYQDNPMAHVQLLEADGDQEVEVSDEFEDNLEIEVKHQSVSVSIDKESDGFVVGQDMSTELLIFKKVVGPLPRLRERTTLRG